ncbi:MAG: phenylalanine--tRNA ligase subunit beta [Candidatus Sumerlaeia bacterium]|nr:phenylalanine--tRNA ligase subunit beta [Candidatus Sumerlaeia bacterium]
MRFNWRWLQEYLSTELSYRELVEAITLCGHEVEQEVDLGMGSGRVIFGEILELQKHPDADTLSLCKVKGDKPEPYQIVCGAQNIAVGQRVPLALVDAVLPGGFKLKPTKIRGVDSQGMMCSAKELGLGDDHSGIWIQAEDAPVGQPFDSLIEIKITPNRPDALSLVGLARDLAVKVKGKLTLPEIKFAELAERVETQARVTVEAKADCPRYAARVIRNVKVKQSPLWLRRRLESAGLRPINNIVDITNYVLLEFGHPLHAFDLAKLASNQVIVRNAKAGETIDLLDGSKVELLATDLVIADEAKAIALAGIMGGANSEITETTTTVLLESAYFHPSTIRKTAKRLQKSTDASYRFERGTDYEKLLTALHRAAQLIAELGEGEVYKGHVDVVSTLPKREPIVLSLAKLNTLLGLKLTGREVSDILTKLGFEITNASTEGTMTVLAPTHRPDVHGPADLAEEVARIHGYEKIPTTVPPMKNRAEVLLPLQRLQIALEDELVAQGFHQAVNFSFVGAEDNRAAGFTEDGREIKVLNPLVSEQSVMRRSLVSSILQSVALNLNQSAQDIRLFEIGRTYEWKYAEPFDRPADRSLEQHTVERTTLCVALSGMKSGNWHTTPRPYDFYDIKAVAEALVETLGLTKTVIEPLTDHPYYHPGRAAALLRKGERLLWFGELHPTFARKLDLKKRVFLLECPLDSSVLTTPETPQYKELPRTPASKRDLAVVVAPETTAQQLERTIKSAAGNLLESLDVFDVYVGDKIPAGTKSLAFSLSFRDPNPEATLKDDQVNAAMEAIVAQLEKKNGAKLRGAAPV